MLVYVLFLFVLCTVFIIYNGFRFDYISVNFWLSIVLISLIGGGGVAFGFFDETYFVKPLSDLASLRYSVLGILVYSSLAYTFTLFCFSGVDRKVWSNYIEKPCIYDKGSKISLMMFSLISVTCVLIYQWQAYPSVFLGMILGENSEYLAFRRVELGLNYYKIGITYIKTLAILTIQVLFLSCIVLYSKKKINRLFFFFISVFCFSTVLAAGDKAMLVTLLISSLCLLTYLNIRLSARFLMTLGVSFIGLFITVYMVMMGYPADILVFKIIERVLVAQVVIVFASFEVYPDVYEFIGFSSISYINEHQQVPVAASEILDYFYAEMRDWGAWNVNGVYIHEAWSNWGWRGVLIAPIYTAIINAFFLRGVLRIKKSPLNLAFFSFMSGSVGYFLTGFNGYLINLQYLSLMCVMVFCWLISLLVVKRN